jgi:hypothetical protein
MNSIIKGASMKASGWELIMSIRPVERVILTAASEDLKAYSTLFEKYIIAVKREYYQYSFM